MDNDDTIPDFVLGIIKAINKYHWSAPMPKQKAISFFAGMGSDVIRQQGLKWWIEWSEELQLYIPKKIK